MMTRQPSTSMVCRWRGAPVRRCGYDGAVIEVGRCGPSANGAPYAVVRWHLDRRFGAYAGVRQAWRGMIRSVVRFTELHRRLRGWSMATTRSATDARPMPLLALFLSTSRAGGEVIPQLRWRGETRRGRWRARGCGWISGDLTIGFRVDSLFEASDLSSALHSLTLSCDLSLCRRCQTLNVYCAVATGGGRTGYPWRGANSAPEHVIDSL